MASEHDQVMRAAIAVAARSREKGNMPFGAVLADETGSVVLEAENTVLSDNDCTAHAELKLVRWAWRALDTDTLECCTIYTSTEPCPMCAGTLTWSTIGRLVYGLGAEQFLATARNPDVRFMACRDIFAESSRSIEVIGPVLGDEAARVHLGFWATARSS